MPPGQAELPLEGLQPSTRRVRARARLRDALVTARRRPAQAAGAVAQFLLRWALRIAFPLAGAAAMLHLFPYHATAGGVRFQVQATLFTRSGITADTTFGSWVFDNVDGLPIGVHLSPENVDVVRMASAATQDPQAYVTRLRDDITGEVPRILLWLGGEALVGILVGLAAGAAVNLALRHLRGQPRRRHELRHRGLQLAGALVVLGLVAGYGGLSYNPRWAKQSHLTGTLAALQLFPDQLEQYYQKRATAFDVLSGITAIQAQLQHNLEQQEVPATAYNIMFISDMHLAGTYPLLRQYAENFDVSLVINTGDESQFGTSAELTPAYRKQIRSLTKVAPMIWLAGNHDSPATVDVMRTIRGVTVLGTKTTSPSGGVEVSAQELNAFGLRIGGMPDPRVYGAAPPYGSDTHPVVDPLEREAVDHALRGVAPDEHFDIFASHEPVATAEVVKDLPGRVRQVNSGHLHKQNPDSEVQKDDVIDLVEGSSGAGGLKEVGLDVKRVPIEFSIESVAADCQFTKVVRFQVAGAGPNDSTTVAADAENVTASTIYLNPQQFPYPKTCDTAYGIGPVIPVS